MTRVRILFLVLLLVYWTVSLYALAIVPRAYEDETWQASVGAKLAAQGVLGSDLFEGYHEMEQHYFGFMPLFPVMLAALFRFTDVGLVQARFVTVSCGLLVLALTYQLAIRLHLGARIGLLATALLLGVRVFAVTALHPTGILFLDAVRVARYDVAVPLWGLAALHLYLTGRAQQKLFWYGLAGFLCALAALTHLYGGFFLLCILALMSSEKLSRRPAACGTLLGGFVLPWALYVLYGFAHFDAWRAQTRLYAERFDVLNPAWYIRNLLSEPTRYALGLNETEWWARPGMWLAGIALAATFLWLTQRGWRSQDFAARVLVVVTSIFLGGCGLLLHTKFMNYLFAVLPFLALMLAWGASVFFRAVARRRPRFARATAFVLAAVLFAESALQISQLYRAASTMTSYTHFIARVQQWIPPGARVLGMHHYGLGWEPYAYRSLATPLLLSDPNLEPTPLTLGAALDAQNPAYILIDPHMRAYLSHTAQRTAFWDWMQKRNAARVGSVDDATYGLMEIYRVTP